VPTDQYAAPAAASQITRHGIPLLAWPTEEPVRRILAASRIPRMLMLAAECPPPVITDSLEDWIRDPIDSADLEARATALAHRAGIAPNVPSSPEQYARAEGLASWVVDEADIDRLTLDARRADLAAARARPVVDAESGVVRVGARWAALSERQLPVAAVLVEHFEAIVTRAQLADIYAAVSGSTDPAALKSMMLRLTRRFREVGLSLQIVRGRGFLLEYDDGAFVARV
jgi:DNA-binding response OmpR family regulator